MEFYSEVAYNSLIFENLDFFELTHLTNLDIGRYLAHLKLIRLRENSLSEYTFISSQIKSFCLFYPLLRFKKKENPNNYAFNFGYLHSDT